MCVTAGNALCVNQASGLYSRCELRNAAIGTARLPNADG